MLRIRPHGAFWASLPLALIGLALLTLVFLLAAIVQAVYFCYNSHYAPILPPLPMAACQLGSIGIVGLSVSGICEPWPVQIP